MNFIALRGFCLGGGIDILPGQSINLDEIKADRLLREGRIAPAEEVAEEVPAPTTAPTKKKKGGHNDANQ